MRIVIISRCLPFPADNGGKLRVAHLSLYLAQRHEVALVCFAEGEKTLPDRVELADRFVDFKVLPPATPGSRLRRWLSPATSEMQEFNSAEMAHAVNSLVDRFDPDVLVAGDPALTRYVAPYPDRVRVLDYVCVGTLQLERLQAISSGRGQVLWALRRLKFAAHLRQIARHYDLCVVNSEEDRAALLAAAPGWARVEVISNGLDLGTYPLGLAAPQPNTLVYPGSLTYAPNLDAAHYFVKDILPRIRAEVPATRLLITGKVPTGGSAPEGPAITYTGYVPDVRPVIAGAWVCPVPLRAGAGGTRFKVLEALALGTPIVSTAIGAEGVAVTDGVDILMAEEPADFATQTVKVLRSPELRNRLATAGRRLIEQQYDWEVLGARFGALISELMSGHQPAMSPAYTEGR
jgi:glycosyltransferase involved in cell wall biosynthesis